jgi:hypothetical protein
MEVAPGMKLRHPALRVAVPALGIALLLVGTAAASRALHEEPSVDPPADVVAVGQADVRRVVVETAERQVELSRTGDGTWTGGAGTPRAAEALMTEVEERLFPLQAYRSLPGDAASDEFGLDDPEITFRIEDTDGGEHEVLLGGPTFTSGGVYARLGSDETRVYLVPRRMMDDLRSLVAGRRIDTPNDLPEKLQEKTPKHDPTSWWLRQVEHAEGHSPGGSE